jgi:hypothetical protein
VAYALSGTNLLAFDTANPTTTTTTAITGITTGETLVGIDPVAPTATRARYRPPQFAFAESESFTTGNRT